MACLAFINLILMDPCIVDYSIEIPARCSFVIEFIIPKFIEAQRFLSGTLLTIRSTTLYSLELLMMSSVPLETL
jgi:hypothetical protein